MSTQATLIRTQFICPKLSFLSLLPTFLLVYDGLQRLLCGKNNSGIAKEHFDFSQEDKQRVRAYHRPREVLQDLIFQTVLLFEISQIL